MNTVPRRAVEMGVPAMTDETAFRQLQDELEIRNLIARLAHLAD